MNEVLRKEKKFLITLDNYYKYSDYLSKLMVQDKHNGDYGYKIRSLYFDTLNDNDFFDKENGVELRRKIRLRSYNPHDDYAILEMKQKQGDNQLKRSLKMKKQDAIELTRGRYESLLKYPEPFAAECYGLMHMKCYRPKSVVEYDRRAFIASENNIRITFDMNIIATESCFDIFSENLCMNPVFDKFNVVMEVKYNNFMLSYIREFINMADSSELSVSKYCLSRSTGLHYIF